MSSKRGSVAPAVSKPPTTLGSGLVISEQASLSGTKLVTIGSNVVIHPRSKLNSQYMPITIGDNCIISERSHIGVQSEEAAGESSGVVINNGVVIEPGAVIEANEIGDGCIIEANSKIGVGAVLGKHCKVGPSCEVSKGEIVPDFTVIYGTGERRKDTSGTEKLQLDMVMKQVDVLKKLIPSSVSYFQKQAEAFAA
ncbi:hypothetical protein K3495_g8817 [Podosphaera aphanis]|nr:hypothetical protein K3495_g8817 [Podosphaera aphanis]